MQHRPSIPGDDLVPDGMAGAADDIRSLVEGGVPR
jgi:hypothetical protein